MKKLIIVAILATFAIQSFAQAPYDSLRTLTKISAYGQDIGNYRVRYSFWVPTDTIRLKVADSNAMALKNGVLYYFSGYSWIGIAGGGGSTMTNFTANDLTPLFDVTVTNPTTTPDLSFSLKNINQYHIYGRKDGGSGVPSFLLADSTLIYDLHSEAYYDTKYLSTGTTFNLQQVTDLGNSTSNNIQIAPGFGGWLDLGSSIGFGQTAGPYSGYLNRSSLTGNRNWFLPDASGTLALKENVWSKTGDAGTDVNSFLGTTDSVKALQFRLRNSSAGYVGQPSWLDESPYPQIYSFPGSAITAMGWKAAQGVIDIERSGTGLPGSGFGNTMIGSNAGENIGRKIDPDSAWVRSGSAVMVGSHAGINNQYGNATGYSRAVYIGALAGFMNVASVGTTIVGGNAGERMMKVTNNTAIGTSSLRTAGNSSYNTAVGAAAGYMATGIIDKVNVTSGGSGYTTATVTIDPPKTYAQGNMPYINENPATATAILSGGAVVGITVTDPGAGYLDTYNITATHGSSGPPMVTITGDGTGATATAVVANSNHNTYLGNSASWKYRGGSFNTMVGSNTGRDAYRTRDSSITTLGYNTGIIAGNASIKNATAIGANTQLGQSNTVILGDSTLTTNVGIGTSFPDTFALKVRGKVNITDEAIIDGMRVTASNSPALLGISIGNLAGPDPSSTAAQNNLIGVRAGANLTTGNQNTVFGYNGMYQSTTAFQSIAIGHNALRAHQTGSNNVAIGYESMYNSAGTSTGSYNTAINNFTLRNTTTASHNFAAGWAAGQYVTTGSGNVFIGAKAGQGVTTGSSNIVIGHNLDTTGFYDKSQQLNIGGWLRGDSGRIAIGAAYSEPVAQLDVKSTTKGVLLPRMNTTQQNAISAPPVGLIIFNTDTADYMVYKVSSWERIGAAGGGGGGSGEVNTASNLGGGLANYSTKVGVDLRFNSFDGTDFDLASNLFTIDGTLKANWNTAFSQTRQWDGGATGLVAGTGRTSLGGTTIGQNMFTLTNPSAVRFPRFNADNTITPRTAAELLSDIGGISSVGNLQAVTNVGSSTTNGITVANGGVQLGAFGGNGEIYINTIGGVAYTRHEMGKIAMTDGSNFVELNYPPVSGTYAISFPGTGGTVALTSDIGAAISGTANEVAYFNTTNTVASLPVATYPSLTELSYVKGVTSLIQPQINGKQSTITFGTGVLAALGVNIGSAGAPVLFDGAGGTPSSLTGTNISGTAASLTAGNATTLANTRTIWGQNFNGSANVTGLLTLGANDLTMTGSIAATGARVTKGWFTDIESTNMPTVGGTSLSSTFQPLDADLTTIAGLTATTDNFMVANASAWASRTPAQAKTSLSLNNVENTALSTWAGTTNINTLGTVATGTWNGSTINQAYLGSGGGGSTKFLREDNTWQTVAGGSLTVGTSAISSGTGGRVLYETSGNVLGEVTGATSDGTKMTLAKPSINNIEGTYTTTATAAGTTTLTVTSTYDQFFTGSTTQTIVMPDATTLTVGMGYHIVNNSTGRLTVNKNGGTLIRTMAAGTEMYVQVTDISAADGTYTESYSGTVGSASLASNFTTSSTTAVSTNLTFPVGANEVYNVVIEGTASKATSSTGLKIAIAAPSGATIKGEQYGGAATLAALPVPALITTINTLGTTFATGTGVEVTFRAVFRVKMSSTAGDVTLQGATVTSNVATIYAGTRITWTKAVEL